MKATAVFFVAMTVLCLIISMIIAQSASVDEYAAIIEGNRYGIAKAAEQYKTATFYRIVAGVLFLIAVPVVIFARRKEKEDASFRKCPRCAELVKKEAVICRFCQYQFTNVGQPVAVQKPTRDPSVIMPGDIPNPRVKLCPDCGQELMVQAVRCRHCGFEFEPRLTVRRR
jgi:preprotein translocase subunit SecG